jgi:hypothetical protein
MLTGIEKEKKQRKGDVRGKKEDKGSTGVGDRIFRK